MSDRFFFDGDYAVRPIAQKPGKAHTLLAFIEFTDLETGLQYKDFKLMNGKNGPWVSSESKQYTKRDGTTDYSNFVQPAYDFDAKAKNERGVAWFDELTQAAYAKYEEMGGAPQQQASRAPAAPRQSAAPRTSGRGPVAPPPVHAPSTGDLPVAGKPDLPF